MNRNIKHQWIDYYESITESDWIIGIDPGHGGMHNGEYQTFPNKMYKHSDFTFYEGVFNRIIAGKLSNLLLKGKISHYFTTDSNFDIGLQIRVIKANNMKRLYFDKKHLFLSIHANAAPKGAESATGIEVFTSKGDTDADPMAEIFFKHLSKMCWKMRKDYRDGDSDKEANFKVLRDTFAPAVLVELGFYTNYDEAKLLMDEEIQDKLAFRLYRAIQEIMKNDQDG